MEFSEPTACSRPLTRSDETNALGLQKILVLPRRCCFEIVFSKMSPLIRLHRSNHSKYAVHHQGSRGNSPSRHKLQRRASGLVQSVTSQNFRDLVEGNPDPNSLCSNRLNESLETKTANDLIGQL